MTAVTSNVGVCNLALGFLKERPITSISPPDAGRPAANACAKWYDTARLQFLRKHPWNFAIKRKGLAASSTAPAFGYNSAFPLENDHIRLLTVGQYDDITDYQLENGRILSNESGPLYIRYIYDNTDIRTWDYAAIMALAAYMAQLMSYEITGNSSLGESLKDTVNELMIEAKSVDGQERPPQRVERSHWLERRKLRSSIHDDWRTWGNT